MGEADLMRRIQVALSANGARLFRNNVGVLKDARGQYVAYGLCKGSSDLIGWTKTGRFLAIEVKTEGGKTTEEQKRFIEAVNLSGGLAFVARSVDEAIEKYLWKTN
jgi:hypothetical protein